MSILSERWNFTFTDFSFLMHQPKISIFVSRISGPDHPVR
jgi:hypothetical protein